MIYFEVWKQLDLLTEWMLGRESSKDAYKIQDLPNGRVSLPLLGLGEMGRLDVGKVTSVLPDRFKVCNQ